MTLEIARRRDPGTLVVQRERLAFVRGVLAEREAELAHHRAQLSAFEGQYLRQVGVLYAKLDELEARIAEREVDLYDSDAARQRAEESRQRARETHEAAFGAAHEAPEFDPPPDLKRLFRDVAKRIHPDFARDDEERTHLTLVMAMANQAYRRGDTQALQRLLDDHRETQAPTVGEESEAEMVRITRQIRHAERDIAALEAERARLLAGEIAQLYLEAQAASREHRDLLMELAARLQEQIADARYRLEFTERQVSAHGR